MSVARRAVTPGTRALIIDDFMRGGGSIKGITDILAEFDASVAGVGVAISSVKPEKKKIENYKALIFLGNVDEENKTIETFPNKKSLPNSRTGNTGPWISVQSKNSQARTIIPPSIRNIGPNVSIAAIMIAGRSPFS